MDIPFEHIQMQKLLKSYARFDPSVLMPDGTTPCHAGKGEVAAPLTRR